jgi:hypothetical protein
MNGKGHSDAVSDENKEHAIGGWKKSNPYLKPAKNLPELYSCSSVLWKVEHVCNKTVYSAEDIFR